MAKLDKYYSKFLLDGMGYTAIVCVVLAAFAFAFGSGTLLLIAIVGFITGCIVIGIIDVIKFLKKERQLKQQEAEEKEAERLQAEKEPIKLEYDPTKAKPWCVQEWNGVRFVQVSGWFAKYENAEKVYEQLCRIRKMQNDSLKNEIIKN